MYDAAAMRRPGEPTQTWRLDPATQGVRGQQGSNCRGASGTTQPPLSVVFPLTGKEINRR